MPDAKRRVLWHGTLMVLFGLATWGILQSFANPRLALAAHVGRRSTGPPWQEKLVAAASCRRHQPPAAFALR
jgi:hypothetical protein